MKIYTLINAVRIAVRTDVTVITESEVFSEKKYFSR